MVIKVGRGVDGVDGDDGNTILAGTTAPGAGLGVDGDFYIDVVGADIYGPKTAGAWGAATSLVGPPGDDGDDGAPGSDGPPGADGADGADGAPGVDGSTVLSGAGAPDPGDGVDGDFYIDTADWDIYGPKTAGAWGPGSSLVGPPGADGDDGAPGSDGADGADGPPGADGADGRTILAGTDEPEPGDGVDGDFFLDTSTWTIYGPKTAGDWGDGTSLVGPGFEIPAGAGAVVWVNHGATGSTTRPAVDVGVLVIWVGTATPANAIDGDLWVDETT